MHPENPFQKDYDFDTLVAHSNTLKNFVFVNQFGTKTIKWADRNAVKSLNAALLKAHYAIDWDIPDNNLCPPIPGRLDYLLYASELLQKDEVSLLDIGAGSNLIYPILGTCHFNWQCTASEANLDSLENAKKLIAENPKLQTIALRRQKFKSCIFEHIIQTDDRFDIVVCNPPFFKNASEAHRKNQRKVKNLKLSEENDLNFGGLSNELWYKGGEEAFIKKMALESEKFKKQVNWFTALVSRKENLKNIKRAVNKTKPTEVKVVDMHQGNKNSRFIAWTFR